MPSIHETRDRLGRVVMNMQSNLDEYIYESVKAVVERYKRRIFSAGRNESLNVIGQYSTTMLYINAKYAERFKKLKFKPRGKNTAFASGTRKRIELGGYNYKTIVDYYWNPYYQQIRKSMRFNEGYRELRQAAGLPVSNVKLKASGKLEASIQIRKVRKNHYRVQFVDNAQFTLARHLESRYGNVFNFAVREEKDLMDRISGFIVKSLKIN